jgi:hypothetical protein
MAQFVNQPVSKAPPVPAARSLTIAAWAIMLFASLLPTIVVKKYSAEMQPGCFGPGLVLWRCWRGSVLCSRCCGPCVVS